MNFTIEIESTGHLYLSIEEHSVICRWANDVLIAQPPRLIKLIDQIREHLATKKRFEYSRYGYRYQLNDGEFWLTDQTTRLQSYYDLDDDIMADDDGSIYIDDTADSYDNEAGRYTNYQGQSHNPEDGCGCEDLLALLEALADELG